MSLHPSVSALTSRPKSSHESPESQNVWPGQCRGGLWALCSTQSGLQGQLHLRIRHYDKAEVHLIPDIPSALQHGTVGQETALRWPQVAHSQLPRVGLFFGPL